MTSSPAIQAARVYDQEPCANTFEHDLYWHLQNGYVFSTPEYFIMGRPVKKDAPEWLLLRPDKKIEGTCDAWLVWLAAGRLDVLPDVMPYWLPWIGFQRRNKLRWYETDRLLRGTIGWGW